MRRTYFSASRTRTGPRRSKCRACCRRRSSPAFQRVRIRDFHTRITIIMLRAHLLTGLQWTSALTRRSRTSRRPSAPRPHTCRGCPTSGSKCFVALAYRDARAGGTWARSRTSFRRRWPRRDVGCVFVWLPLTAAVALKPAAPAVLEVVARRRCISLTDAQAPGKVFEVARRAAASGNTEGGVVHACHVC